MAIANFLSNRHFIGGDAPCSADASVYATVAGFLSTHFESAIGDEARKHPQLAAYVERMKARYFADTP